MKQDFSELIEALKNLQHEKTTSIDTDILRISELEGEYEAFLKNHKGNKFNFGNWIPSLGDHMRPLVPGEIVTILADTGVGKTALLHNIAIHAAPLKTLLFEVELPGTLTFERFVSLQTNTPGNVVEKTYDEGRRLEWKKTAMDHIFVCSHSRLAVDDIERIILASKEKIGERPTLVLIDYIGLLQGRGTSRYERMSYVAEELKKMAKATNTIMIVASQIHRKNEKDSGEIYLHDAKDSGSIENSSGAVLGVWREGDGGECMKIKILKQTKGRGRHIAHCQFDGPTSRITEIPDPKKIFRI